MELAAGPACLSANGFWTTLVCAWAWELFGPGVGKCRLAEWHQEDQRVMWEEGLHYLPAPPYPGTPWVSLCGAVLFWPHGKKSSYLNLKNNFFVTTESWFFLKKVGTVIKLKNWGTYKNEFSFSCFVGLSNMTFDYFSDACNISYVNFSLVIQHTTEMVNI